jgi:hypothetical protein
MHAAQTGRLPPNIIPCWKYYWWVQEYNSIIMTNLFNKKDEN